MYKPFGIIMMKTCLVVLTAVACSACANPTKIMVGDREFQSTAEANQYAGELNAESDRQAEVARIEERARESQRQSARKPGNSLSKFKRAWGEPNRTGYADGKMLLYYSMQSPPMVFGFRKNRLVEWGEDTALVLQRSQEAAEQRQYEQREAMRRDADRRHQEQIRQQEASERAE